MSSKRKYELKKRADAMADTRRRITEAAVELHGSVGPARTTVSAIAERAGVQRHTVYRHFPTDADMFAACSAHYYDSNPWPDLEAWRAIGDPRRRLAEALEEIYAYYERNEPMFSNVLRDVELVDGLGATLTGLRAYLAEAIEVLATGWGTRGRRRRVLVAALGHVLDFRVWRSLTASSDLSRIDAVGLSAALVEAAAAPRQRAAA